MFCLFRDVWTAVCYTATHAIRNVIQVDHLHIFQSSFRLIFLEWSACKTTPCLRKNCQCYFL